MAIKKSITYFGQSKKRMFYFGILSSYIPYLLFFMASVFYLGFNYIQNTNPEAQADKIVLTQENTEYAYSESSSINLADASSEQCQAFGNDHQKFIFIEKNRSHKILWPCINNYSHSPCYFLFSRPPPTVA